MTTRDRPSGGGRGLASHAGGANDHQRKMFAESLHAALTLAEVRELVMQLGYDPNSVKQTTDRHWTWSAKRLGS